MESDSEAFTTPIFQQPFSRTLFTNPIFPACEGEEDLLKEPMRSGAKELMLLLRTNIL